MCKDTKQSFYNYTISKKSGVPPPNLYNIQVHGARPRRIYCSDRVTYFAEFAKKAKSDCVKAGPTSYDPKVLEHKAGARLKCHLKQTDERVTPA